MSVGRELCVCGCAGVLGGWLALEFSVCYWILVAD
jgi:hypothetical protein